MASKGAPPLPPRQTSSTPPPPPYSIAPAGTSDAQPSHQEDNLAMGDPRSSSSQSLAPSESNAQNERRKLLLLYIHGFMGDETSFRSFPAHVHNLLTVLLAETHVVHTKIYPRYRSRRNIRFARDDFSTWLEPHESDRTDTILLGHSMGGLLSAEVVLLAPPAPASRPLKHRILGSINFDVPFLGMHPGVVKSGLSSIFQSAEYEDKWSEISPTVSGDTPSSSSMSSLGQSASGRTDTLWQPPKPETNFPQRFANDVVLPVRKGWENAFHFVHKHSKNLSELTKATQNLVTSHLEFGGAMANYSELKTRYGRVRVLEDENAAMRKRASDTGSAPARVRFVNYYTVSTGRARKIKPSSRSPSTGLTVDEHGRTRSQTDEEANGFKERLDVPTPASRSASPRISLEQYSDDGTVHAQLATLPPQPVSEDWEAAAESLTIGEDGADGKPMAATTEANTPHDALSLTPSRSSLPPIPDLPRRPLTPDLSSEQDLDTRKLLSKEHARAIKAYEKAVQNREKTIKDRKKLEEKRAKAQQKKLESESADAMTLSAVSTTSLPLSAVESQNQPIRRSSRSPSPNVAPHQSKRKREHTFCSLPPRDSNGQPDSTWVRVFMQDVDEVGAHCGLFFIDERYERLVGDVAERIEQWVHEDANRRFMIDANAEPLD